MNVKRVREALKVPDSEDRTMNPIAMTLIAPASEPNQGEARTHAMKNCVSVILVLASTIERHVDPVARPRVTRLVDAHR
jgi:hypothetical protein